MRKRLLCVLMILATIAAIMAASVSAVTKAAASTQDGTYRVGFAKVDINPYYDENNHSKGLMPLPMGGNGFETQRLGVKEKLDDNGDGLVNDSDGLFSTCIAITDPSGQTLLFFSLDYISGGIDTIVFNPVREQLCKLYPDLSADRIVFTCSHTHSGPKLSAAYMKNEVFGENVTLYVQRLTNNLVKAGKAAMTDRSEAKMYKGSLDATKSAAANKPIGDTLNAQQKSGDKITVLPAERDRLYNVVRHYVNTVQLAKRSRTVDFSKEHPYEYTYQKNAQGKYIADTTQPVLYIASGANFNTTRSVGSTVNEVYFVFKGGARAEGVTEKNVTTKTVSGKTQYYNAAGTQVYRVVDTYVVTGVDHVSEADDTMHIVEFRFTDASKKPVAMVNWRAHTTLNRKVSDDFEELKAQGKYQDLGFYTSYFQYSGDWVNAMRYTLERAGYRTSFFQGAAGNIAVESRMDDMAWAAYETKTDRSHVRNKGNIYGSEVAEVALELLGSGNMQQINKTGGNIRSVQRLYQSTRQQVPEGLYAAAEIYAAEYKASDPTGLYLYTHTDGQVYKITSIHHANSVLSRYSSNGAAAPQLELNAISIGKELAFITAPNELFDRYSSDATLETVRDKNDWDKLNGASYGEPFVVGYANQSKSYMPAAISYTYSEGVDFVAQGSYESLTSNYAQGNGEAIMDEFDWMLDYVMSDESQTPETREGYCDRCEKDVTWYALNESELLIANLKKDHYYLDSDTERLELNTKRVLTGLSVCLDLNGKTLVSNGPVFTVSSGATLSILGEGTVKGSGGNSTGGTVVVEAGGTLNLHSGTLAYEKDANEELLPSTGGILHISGTFNMYGGTVEGTHVTNAGAAAYFGVTSQANLYGGKITAGTADVAARCVYARGYLKLSGSANVTNIQLSPAEGGPALGEMVTVEGKFTGTVTLRVPSAASGVDIGTNSDADLSEASIAITSYPNLSVVSVRGDLLLTDETKTLCSHCGKKVIWVALDHDWQTYKTLSQGHYYLVPDEGMTYSVQTEKRIPAGHPVCLDLRDTRYVATYRAFDMEEGSKLTLLGAATVTGRGTKDIGNGGVIRVGKDAVLNVYEATLSFQSGVNDDRGVHTGGVLYVNGTLNMYGGAVKGTAVPNVGGAIYGGGTSQLNLLGGSVTDGTAEVTGICVYARGGVKLANDASVSELLLNPADNGLLLEDMLTVSGAYTGTTVIRRLDAAAGMDIGTNENADLSGATISIYGKPELRLVADRDDLILTDDTAECPHCNKVVGWVPLTDDWQTYKTLTQGHYYIDTDSTYTVQTEKDIPAGHSVCLDLRGKRYMATLRAFELGENATLSILGRGTMSGRGVKEEKGDGGCIYVPHSATLNLYEATLTFEDGVNLDRGAYRGGVLYVDGTFNMYGGLVKDGVCSWVGGNIYLGTKATMTMSGGSITGGSAGQTGKCVVNRGVVTLKNGASIEQLRQMPDDKNAGGPLLGDMLVIDGAYTGTVALEFTDVPADGDVGNGINGASVTGGKISVLRNGALRAQISDGELLLLAAVALERLDGTAEPYTTLQAALNAYGQTGEKIILNGDITENITVTGSPILDLNGCALTGKVAGSGTLVLQDSQTDDFNVEDGNGYGKITGTAANAVAADGYVKIVEDGVTSVHKIDLTIKSMGLRPAEAGLYFKSDFAGDQVVARNVDSFGVALSVTGAPDETTLQNPLHFTRYEKEAFGTGADNTSTLLTGVLKEDNGYNTNVRNSKLQVYGRAYIEIDGEYTFGVTRNRNMVEQLEGIDAQWSKLTQAQIPGIQAMYNTYKQVMREWELPNLKASLS